MRRSIHALGLLSVLALAAPVHAAPSLGGVRVVHEGDDVAVRVLADAPLENARVRTERGRIRVWFREVLNQPRLEIDGDGRAIARVGLAPGMEETVVLRIDLGHSVRVDASDVRIEPTEDGCLVHVPTGWLPPAEPAPAPATAEVAAPSAAVAEPGSPSDASAAIDDEPAVASAPARPALGARPEPESAPLGTREATSLPLAPLAGIALVLLLVWIYARKQRRGGGDRSDIQILATHRLGPKHQLLVVRALGQDHLLAVHGQSTQVLGTTKPTEERPTSSFLSRLREVSDERAVPPPPAPAASESDERFGARLLSLVGGRDVSPREPEPTVTHDSVAGLLRLKARQGGG